MSTLMDDIIAVAKIQNDAYSVAYQVGHAVGYKTGHHDGYLEGLAKAQEMIDKAFAKPVEPVCPTCGGKGATAINPESGEIVTYCGCE